MIPGLFRKCISAMAVVPLLAAAQSVPVAVSVSPSSGTGSSQTFSFVYTNSSGAANIWYTVATINTSTSWVGGCTVDYVPGSQTLYLQNDAGTEWMGPITPGSGTLQNSQCSLNGAASSATLSGDTLTVNLALTFVSSFEGSKNVYMHAVSSGGGNDW